MSPGAKWKIAAKARLQVSSPIASPHRLVERNRDLEQENDKVRKDREYLAARSDGDI